MSYYDSKWTPDLVLAHMLAVQEANDLRYQAKFQAQEKETNEALAALEKDVDALTVATQKAVDALSTATRKDIEILSAAVHKAASSSEATAESLRSTVNEWRSTLIERDKNFPTRDDFSRLKERLDRTEGSNNGMRDLWGWIVAAVVSGVALIDLLSRVLPK